MMRTFRRVPVTLVTLVSFIATTVPHSAFADAAPARDAKVEERAEPVERPAAPAESSHESKVTDESVSQRASAKVAPVEDKGSAGAGAAADPATTLSLPTGADKSGVTSQAISVPQGAGKVQGMGESFSTQLSTGVAMYSIPIALPHARGGAQPSLSLSYSSSLGHGVAGLGWDIGVPYISRQTDRGIPQYRDPATGGAWAPTQDRFVFNGGQELVPICLVAGGLTCSGAVSGENMPSWSSGYQYFRPRVEGSFQRFFWSPDHQTWRVQDKSGVTMELGVPLDDSSNVSALERDPTGTKIFRWNITREYDANGGDTPVNIVKFGYVFDGLHTYLWDIYDTPPASAPPYSLGSYAHHTHIVLEGRPDFLTTYRRGWEDTTRYRIARIEVASFPMTPGDHREMVRKYYLSYNTTGLDVHPSLLSAVQMEGRCTDAVTEDASGLLPSSACLPRLPAITLGYSHVKGLDAGGAPQTSDLAGFEPFVEITLEVIQNQRIGQLLGENRRESEADAVSNTFFA